MLYRLQNLYDDKKAWLLTALKGSLLKLGDIDLYEAWCKLGKAKEWRAKLLQVEAVEE